MRDVRAAAISFYLSQDSNNAFQCSVDIHFLSAHKWDVGQTVNSDPSRGESAGKIRGSREKNADHILLIYMISGEHVVDQFGNCLVHLLRTVRRKTGRTSDRSNGHC